MEKKIPKLYHGNDIKKPINKKSYYSEKKTKEEKEIKEEINNIPNNFFKYLNKTVTIITKDNKTLNTKIISKFQNRILLEDNNYLTLEEIKSIK